MEDSDFVKGAIVKNYLADEIAKLPYVDQELMRPFFRCPKCHFQTMFARASTPYFKHYEGGPDCDYLTRRSNHGEGEGTITVTKPKPTKIVLKFSEEESSDRNSFPPPEGKLYKNKRKFTSDSDTSTQKQLSLKSALKRLINNTLEPDEELEVLGDTFKVKDLFVRADEVEKGTRGFHGVWGTLHSIKHDAYGDWINFNDSCLNVYSKIPLEKLRKVFPSLNNENYVPQTDLYFIIFGHIKGNIQRGTPSIYPSNIGSMASLESTPKLYMLLRRNLGLWDNDSKWEIDSERFLEHTSEYLKLKYSQLNNSTKNMIKSIPALFTYENSTNNQDKKSYLGQIKEMELNGNILSLSYNLTKEIPSEKILNKKMFAPLGIVNVFENTRTHISLKEIDLDHALKFN